MRALMFNCRQGELLARTNGASQSCVVTAIFAVPQWHAVQNSLAKCFDFFGTSSRSICWDKGFSFVRHEILIVTVLKNRLENVSDLLMRRHKGPESSQKGITEGMKSGSGHQVQFARTNSFNVEHSGLLKPTRINQNIPESILENWSIHLPARQALLTRQRQCQEKSDNFVSQSSLPNCQRHLGLAGETLPANALPSSKP